MIFQMLDQFRQSCLDNEVHAIRLVQMDADMAFAPELNPMGNIDTADLGIEILQRPQGPQAGESYSILSNMHARRDLPDLKSVIDTLIPVMRERTFEAKTLGYDGKIHGDTVTSCTLHVDDMRLVTEVEIQLHGFAEARPGAQAFQQEQEYPLSVELWALPAHRFELLLRMLDNPLFDAVQNAARPVARKPFKDIASVEDYVAAVRAGPLSRRVLDEAYAVWGQNHERNGFFRLNVPQQWLIHATALHARDLSAQDAKRLLRASVYAVGANPHVILSLRQIYSLFITGVGCGRWGIMVNAPEKLPLSLHALVDTVSDAKNELRDLKDHGRVASWFVSHVERLAERIAQAGQAGNERQRQNAGEQFRRQVTLMLEKLDAVRRSPVQHSVPHTRKALELLMDALDERLMRLNMKAKVPVHPMSIRREAIPAPLDVL